MNIGINLATQPFRRDRPMLVASGALAIALGGLFGLLLALGSMESGQMGNTRTEIARLDRQIQQLAAEQAKLDTVLRQPENAVVLERSIFLNALLLRKGISWTRIFEDLEKTLPFNVRLISIRPMVNAQNQISLEMNVGAETPGPVVEMVRRLESSDVFEMPQVHTTLPPSQTDPLYRYRVSVNYAQKL